MEINIFNVSHGFCAYLIADNGNVMLFDCGHNEETGWRPSSHLLPGRCSGIERLIIQNYDEDHISDLYNLFQIRKIPVTSFYQNSSISAEALRSIKLQTGPISANMEILLKLKNEYIHELSYPPQFPNIELKIFHNDYPVFTDTNNLSLVSFIHCDGISMIFPGDIEKAGWKELLKIPSFRHNLQKINIFIASHHGRESGYCEDVFLHCSPDIFIISDEKIKYETQGDYYSKHASGVPWNGDRHDRRYVLTTRSDGMIKIENKTNGGYHIAT